MKSLWMTLGKLLVIGGWPFLFFYLRLGKRTRLVLMADNSILLVQGWLNSNNQWGLPGGGLHRGEDPAKGVSRELFEETGLAIAPDSLKLHGLYNGGQRGLNFTYYGFSVHLDQMVRPKIRGIEIVDARWVDIGQLSKLNVAPDALDLISKVNQ